MVTMADMRRIAQKAIEESGINKEELRKQIDEDIKAYREGKIKTKSWQEIKEELNEKSIENMMMKYSESMKRLASL